jgi:hypothetical protein
MDAMTMTTLNASAGYVPGAKSALKPCQAIVPFRVRTQHAGAGLIDRTFAPDSAPWMHPVC